MILMKVFNLEEVKDQELRKTLRMVYKPYLFKEDPQTYSDASFR